MKGLKHFILQYQVLSQYRKFVKVAFRISDLQFRTDILENIRGGFEMNRRLELEKDINLSLKDGDQQLQYLVSRIDQTS